MSRFIKLYNRTENCWKRIIYKLSNKRSVMTEAYSNAATKYKTPIGLVSIKIYNDKGLVEYE